MSEVVDLMQATVRLEQALPSGQSTVGTGFMVVERGSDGAPRILLVTAHHVLARMPSDKAKVGLRRREPDGRWRYAPIRVRIRDADGDPLWTRHPTQDVAALELPSALRLPALPIEELPGERALASLEVEPGDEMMALGFPRGYSANAAGFPILRAGKVASYPLSPADRYPTYLVDFNVFAGNSGGPVYVVRATQRNGGPPQRQAVITGILTQQLKADGDRLAIGNVTQADYIAETIALAAGQDSAEIAAAEGDAPVPESAVASSPPRLSAGERLRQAWDEFWIDGGVLVRRAWIVARDWVLDRVTRDAKIDSETSG